MVQWNNQLSTVSSAEDVNYFLCDWRLGVHGIGIVAQNGLHELTCSKTAGQIYIRAFTTANGCIVNGKEPNHTMSDPKNSTTRGILGMANDNPSVKAVPQTARESNLEFNEIDAYALDSGLSTAFQGLCFSSWRHITDTICLSYFCEDTGDKLVNLTECGCTDVMIELF
ncbi:hypothetical protein RF11_10545 [Thelohanellus kitauei]|uniref:Uncharacterized protein n=1 Tax=Thelohanellus kitauei TaxID=669202 RepID=A0A0C2NFH6_THEKT|nr:hypothetical protein RF11_10545 [Thelohanellus kitauei]